MMTTKNPKIAIAFYGITRSLKYTFQSIQDNIIQPSKNSGYTKTFCHFFIQKEINNPRTNEIGKLDENEWKILNCDHSKAENCDTDYEINLFEKLIQFGNAWEDNGESLKNIIRQLESLKRVTQIIQENFDPDIVIFARPDMLYHNPFPINEIQKKIKNNTIIVPYWSWSGGLNDRFSICGSKAYTTYGTRINNAHTYCKNKGKPLHSERLLMYSIQHSQCQLDTTNLSATRIRSNGDAAEENFSRVKIAKRIEAFLLCNLYTKINTLTN